MGRNAVLFYLLEMHKNDTHCPLLDKEDSRIRSLCVGFHALVAYIPQTKHCRDMSKATLKSKYTNEKWVDSRPLYRYK